MFLKCLTGFFHNNSVICYLSNTTLSVAKCQKGSLLIKRALTVLEVVTLILVKTATEPLAVAVFVHA